MQYTNGSETTMLGPGSSSETESKWQNRPRWSTITTYVMLHRGTCETILWVDLARRQKVIDKDIIIMKWTDPSDTRSSPNECRSVYVTGKQ